MNKSMTDILKTIHHYAGSYTATETPSAGVDLLGARRAEVVVTVGSVANIAVSPQPTWAFSLEESDSSGSGFTAVDAIDITLGNANNDAAVVSGVFATVADAATDNTTFRCGYIGMKRYLRVVATAANTPGASIIGVIFLIDQDIKPASDV